MIIHIREVWIKLEVWNDAIGGFSLDKSIEFDYMFRNNKVAHVKYDKETGKVEQEVYGKAIFDRPIPRLKPTAMDLLAFFEDRCFPRTRFNCDQLLEDLGLPVYSPYHICLKTRGRQWDDFYWIKFKGDTATFDEIKLRD